jgi:hypothetical protein
MSDKDLIGEVVFIVVLVAIVAVGPLSPVAFGFYWLIGIGLILFAVGKSIIELLDRNTQRRLRERAESERQEAERLRQQHLRATWPQRQEEARAWLERAARGDFR